MKWCSREFSLVLGKVKNYRGELIMFAIDKYTENRTTEVIRNERSGIFSWIGHCVSDCGVFFYNRMFAGQNTPHVYPLSDNVLHQEVATSLPQKTKVLQDSVLSNENSSDIFSVYITHNASMIVKSLGRILSKGKLHIQAVYKNGIFEIVNKDDFPQLNSTRLSFEEFTELVLLLKKKNTLLLCLDANLGNPADLDVSEDFHNFVLAVMPRYLFPFSATPECIDDVNQYLCGMTTRQGYQLSSKNILGVGADVHCIRQMIQKGIENPSQLIRHKEDNRPTLKGKHLFFAQGSDEQTKVTQNTTNQRCLFGCV